MAAAMDDQILYDVFIRSEWNLEGELLVSILNHKPEGRENIIPKNSIILFAVFSGSLQLYANVAPFRSSWAAFRSTSLLFCMCATCLLHFT